MDPQGNLSGPATIAFFTISRGTPAHRAQSRCLCRFHSADTAGVVTMLATLDRTPRKNHIPNRPDEIGHKGTEWMMRNRRAGESPLAHLKGPNVRTDRRHDRTAFEIEEVQRLLAKPPDLSLPTRESQKANRNGRKRNCLGGSPGGFRRSDTDRYGLAWINCPCGRYRRPRFHSQRWDSNPQPPVYKTAD
jgi:hypothetical protein